MTFPSTFVIYDFETTGLDTKTCDVIEIGARLVVDGELKEEKSWLVKAKEPLPAKIVEITGITDEMLAKDGVEEAVAFKEFRALFAGHPLVGHNILKYDNPILVRKLKALFEEEFEPKGCYDTAGFFKAWQMGETVIEDSDAQGFCMRILNKRVAVKYNLGLAYETLGFEKGSIMAHRAGGDVEMVHKIYDDLAKRYA